MTNSTSDNRIYQSALTCYALRHSARAQARKRVISTIAGVGRVVIPLPRKTHSGAHCAPVVQRMYAAYTDEVHHA